MADKVKMPRIGLVVARSATGHVIGRDNGLPWRLTSDLRRFKALTTGHALVMGRKTFESIGRPLPGRTSIVISRRDTGGAEVRDETGVLWAAGLEPALRLADLVTIGAGRDMFFVVGGAEIYRLILDRGLADRAYVTEVFADVDGDATLPYDFSAPGWDLREETLVPAGDGDAVASRFVVYERRAGGARSRDLASLSDGAGPWLGAYLRAHAKVLQDYAATHALGP